jgi:hypothetical protein
MLILALLILEEIQNSEFATNRILQSVPQWRVKFRLNKWNSGLSKQVNIPLILHDLQSTYE